MQHMDPGAAEPGPQVRVTAIGLKEAAGIASMRTCVSIVNEEKRKVVWDMGNVLCEWRW
jgi:hypothetical protein